MARRTVVLDPPLFPYGDGNLAIGPRPSQALWGLLEVARRVLEEGQELIGHDAE